MLLSRENFGFPKHLTGTKLLQKDTSYFAVIEKLVIIGNFKGSFIKGLHLSLFQSEKNVAIFSENRGRILGRNWEKKS